MSKLFQFDNDTVDFNQYDKPLVFQCEQVTRIPPAYGSYWNAETRRCGGDSYYLVTFPNAAGTTTTKHLCPSHAKQLMIGLKDGLKKILSGEQHDYFNTPQADIEEALNEIEEALKKLQEK